MIGDSSELKRKMRSSLGFFIKRKKMGRGGIENIVVRGPLLLSDVNHLGASGCHYSFDCK